MDNLDPATDTQDPNNGAGNVQGNEQGSVQPTSWRENLPDGYKDMPCYEKFDSPEAVLKAYGDVQKLIGKKGIIKPTETSDKEEWNKYYQELGRPDLPDQYSTPEVDLPEPLKESIGDLSEYKQKAHELGLTPQQFEEFVKFHLEREGNHYRSVDQEVIERKRQVETKMRSELGSTYDETIGQTQRMLKNYLGEGGLKVVADTGIGNDPDFIRGMAKLAKDLGEAGIQGGTFVNLTPTQAKAEMAELRQGKALTDKFHPEHSEAKKRFEDLAKMAYPTT